MFSCAVHNASLNNEYIYLSKPLYNIVVLPSRGFANSAPVCLQVCLARVFRAAVVKWPWWSECSPHMSPSLQDHGELAIKGTHLQILLHDPDGSLAPVWPAASFGPRGPLLHPTPANGHRWQRRGTPWIYPRGIGCLRSSMGMLFFKP